MAYFEVKRPNRSTAIGYSIEFNPYWLTHVPISHLVHLRPAQQGVSKAQCSPSLAQYGCGGGWHSPWIGTHCPWHWSPSQHQSNAPQGWPCPIQLGIKPSILLRRQFSFSFAKLDETKQTATAATSRDVIIVLGVFISNYSSSLSLFFSRLMVYILFWSIYRLGARQMISRSIFLLTVAPKWRKKTQ